MSNDSVFEEHSSIDWAHKWSNSTSTSEDVMRPLPHPRPHYASPSSVLVNIPPVTQSASSERWEESGNIPGLSDEYEYNELYSPLPRLFLCLISFLLFPCASVVYWLELATLTVTSYWLSDMLYVILDYFALVNVAGLVEALFFVHWISLYFFHIL